MKIAIGCIFYNAKSELERLLKSIPNKTFDYFIAIDGIFKYTKEQNPTLPNLSTDGSRQLLLSDEIGLTRITNVLSYYTDLPNLEYYKRNKYLEICEEMDIDVLIIVDSDEFFIFPEGTKPEIAFNRFKQNLEQKIEKHGDHNVFGIHTLNIHDDKLNSYKPRIWYKPGEMRYIYGSHYHYANVIREKESIDNFKLNGVCYCQHCPDVIKGVVLAHDHSLRSPTQTKIHDDYVEYLKRFEGLVQSHKYDIEQSHKIASKGISYDDILRGRDITGIL
jgi:hypothetical protein